MSYFVYPDTVTNEPVRLWYESTGAGFPVLLIAPGGMKSSIPLWGNAPWNPLDAWSEQGFRLIAMDQRNAGRSSGPVHADHGWSTFADDQLGLMDHLGIDRFMVAGMCIGGAYCVQLAHRAPGRVAGAVVLQTIGLDANRAAFLQMYDGWATTLAPQRPDVLPADWAGMRTNMYGGEQALFSLEDSQIDELRLPMLVFMGNDPYHPESASRRLAAAVPAATLVERWKTGDDVPAGRALALDFLCRVAAGESGAARGQS